MSLKSLQEKIGVTADGAFGPNTIKAAMAGALHNASSKL